jgi:uncharacterized phage protein (TIGR01671 family)
MLPKFRAWLKDEKKMSYDITIINRKGKSACLQIWANKGLSESIWYMCDNYILMQSNGKKDKNGNELYSGDIVKTDEDGWIAVVKFDGCNFYLEDNKGGYSDIAINWDGCEIIGNVYENPELLEEK